MAWNNYNTDSGDEGKFSEFNSAGLKMKRLDKILSMINEINSNLRAFNIEHGVYNYQLKFSLCDSLFLEIESKLSVEEKTDHKKVIMEAVGDALDPAFAAGFLTGMGLPVDDGEAQRAADNTDEIAAFISGLSSTKKVFLLLMMRSREDKGYLNRLCWEFGLSVN